MTSALMKFNTAGGMEVQVLTGQTVQTGMAGLSLMMGQVMLLFRQD